MLNEVRKLNSDLASRLHEAVVLKNAGFFIVEGLLFIPVPEWEGWKYINHEKYESVDHFARWEVFFYPRGERFWIFLRITWPSLTQILLSFIYPDDRKLLKEINLHRRLALLDRPLTEGLPHPLSSGIIIHDIPVDVLMALGIDSKDGKKSIKVSGAREPPPCALSDTDVNLSAHPAPIIQPSVLCPTANAEITRAAFWQFFPTKKPHSLDGISTFSISSLPT